MVPGIQWLANAAPRWQNHERDENGLADALADMLRRVFAAHHPSVAGNVSLKEALQGLCGRLVAFRRHAALAPPRATLRTLAPFTDVPYGVAYHPPVAHSTEKWSRKGAAVADENGSCYFLTRMGSGVVVDTTAPVLIRPTDRKVNDWTLVARGNCTPSTPSPPTTASPPCPRLDHLRG